MAIRESSCSVVPYNMERSTDFEYGKERFLEEAKTLAEFIGNPDIVKILSYFEENGTAYYVMEYVKGISLKRFLAEKGGRVSWEEAVRILTPVMEALSSVHEKGIIHRDVTPDNIIVTEDGKVKLIDFGAARYSIGERSQSLDVILKHGFAPYEQYIRRSRQGAFTDEYSLAATLYFAITGVIPPDAVERLDDDTLAAPSSLGTIIPPEAESALLKALSVKFEGRFRTIEEFKAALQVETGVGNSDILADNIAAGITDSVQDDQKKDDVKPETEPETEPEGGVPEKSKSEEPSDNASEEKDDQPKEIVFEKKGDQKDQKSFIQKNLLKLIIPLAGVIIIAAFVFGSGLLPGNVVGTEEKDGGETAVAAEAGDAEAQYYIGLMYDNGYGVEQNQEEAQKWYSKAYAQGYEPEQ